jgi:hypothetical protein
MRSYPAPLQGTGDSLLQELWQEVSIVVQQQKRWQREEQQQQQQPQQQQPQQQQQQPQQKQQQQQQQPLQQQQQQQQRSWQVQEERAADPAEAPAAKLQVKAAIRVDCSGPAHQLMQWASSAT